MTTEAKNQDVNTLRAKAAQSSTSDDGSSGEPKTYTEDELNQRIKDEKSTWFRENVTPVKADADAAATLRTENEQLKGTLATITAERERTEREAVADKPDLLDIVVTRQKAQRDADDAARIKRDAEVEAEKVRLARKELDKGTSTSRAATLAIQHSVDASEIIRLSGNNVDVMEDIAKMLPKKGEAPDEPEREPLDSGRGSGSGAKSWTQVQSDYVSGKISREAYEETAKKMNRRP